MVPAPVMVGLLAWWSIVLAAPVVVLRRWLRRRRGAALHRPRLPFRRPRETGWRRGAATISRHPPAPGPGNMRCDEVVEPRPRTEVAAQGGEATGRMTGPRALQPVLWRGVCRPRRS